MTRSLPASLLVCLALVAAEAGAQKPASLALRVFSSQFSEVRREIEARLAGGAKETATLLGPLCFAYGELKDYAKLFNCIDRLEASIKSGDTLIEADYFGVPASDARPLPKTLRSAAYIELGRYEQAITSASAALVEVDSISSSGWAVFSAIRLRFTNLLSLCIAQTRLGNAAAAKKYAKAIEDLGVPFAGSAFWRPLKKVTLARAYMATTDYERALNYLEVSSFDMGILGLGDSMTSLGKDKESVGTAIELPRLLMLGKAQSALGKWDDAKKTLDTLLATPRLHDFGELHWTALNERARLAELGGETLKALDLYARAITIFERQRSTINTEANKIGFAGDKQTVYERAIALSIALDRVAEAFEYVERSKARALVDMLASRKDFAVAADPEKARIILAQLDAADEASRVQAPGIVAPLGGSRNFDVTRTEIQQMAPELATLVTVTSAAPEDLKKLINQGEALLEYYYQGKELYAFVLTRDRLSSYKLDAEGLADEVQGFRQALLEPGTAAWQQGARALHQRLWQPLEASIGARNVIVVAHGALHYLPFATLQGANGKLVIDEYSLRFLPSASVLKFLRPPANGKEGLLLALGNPDLGDPSGDLKFAEEEARSVAKLFPQSRLLVRQEASESNFKKAGGVFSRIHFATHGKFQADDPLNSGLYLAKDGENDGVLTVSELYSMKLDADLVTLSACETGLGKIANGDDVVGLTRGFLYAGTRSIVASLWSVEDKATAALMSAFYENLPRLSKQEALREAQLKTRQDFQHPFFWAAFQLTGRAD